MTESIPPLRPIGVVHSPYRTRSDAPRQGRHREDESLLEIYEDYEAGLRDIERCSHLIALYWMDRGDGDRLRTRTPWGPEVHGVFATRSPNRPNPLGFCVVDLLERRGRVVKVRGLDALDGTPLLDLKPYSSGIDSFPEASVGWHRRADLTPPEKNTQEKEYSVNDIHPFSNIYEFAASAGALEGYVYRRETLSMEALTIWVDNLAAAYARLPKEAKQEIQPGIDQTLGRAIRSLAPNLGEEHEILGKIRSMVAGDIPESPDDFQKVKWYQK